MTFTILSEIKVQDEDTVTLDDTIYKTEYNVKKFQTGKKNKILLKFKKVAIDISDT